MFTMPRGFNGSPANGANSPPLALGPAVGTDVAAIIRRRRKHLGQAGRDQSEQVIASTGASRRRRKAHLARLPTKCHDFGDVLRGSSRGLRRSQASSWEERNVFQSSISSAVVCKRSDRTSISPHSGVPEQLVQTMLLQKSQYRVQAAVQLLTSETDALAHSGGGGREQLLPLTRALMAVSKPGLGLRFA
jgi:hypothetical protein